MPRSKVITRLGGRWTAVEDRARYWAESVGPVGCDATDFESTVLFDSDPRDTGEIIELLHRRGLIWRSRQGGLVRVFGRKPEGEVAGPTKADPDVLDVLRGTYGPIADFEAAQTPDEQDAAVQAIIRLARKEEADGLPLVEFRALLWRFYHPDLMAAVARRSAILDQHHPYRRFPDPPAPRRQKRLPNGLSLEDRVLHHVEQMADEGLTTGALGNKFGAHRVEAIEAAERLAEAGRLTVHEIRVTPRGLPGRRFFPAGTPEPRKVAGLHVLGERGY